MYGEKLQMAPEPPVGSIPIKQLLNGSSQLKEMVCRQAERLHCLGSDLRPAASAWTMAYLESLLPPVCAAATLLHHVFPIEATQTFLVLKDDGRPATFHIRDMGVPMPGTTAQERYRLLFWQHLSPLFDSLHVLTRIPKKILWGNCARVLEGIFDMARSRAPEAPSIGSDHLSLLEETFWPGTGPDNSDCPNPLFGPKRDVLVVVNGRENTLHLHRQCCLFYKLPGVGYCGPCPLDPRHRKSAPRP